MSQESAAERTPEVPANNNNLPKTYEPPKITKIGSLRDVVGKSGANIDFSTHNRSRP